MSLIYKTRFWQPKKTRQPRLQAPKRRILYNSSSLLSHLRKSWRPWSKNKFNKHLNTKSQAMLTLRKTSELSWSKSRWRLKDSARQARADNSNTIVTQSKNTKWSQMSLITNKSDFLIFSGSNNIEIPFYLITVRSNRHCNDILRMILSFKDCQYILKVGFTVFKKRNIK